MSNTPYRIPDEKFVDAVREAYEDGAIDAAEGGVPAAEVADRLDTDVRATRRRLNNLVEENVLLRVLGVNPNTMRRRYGYIYHDSPDYTRMQS